ncbi:hypothetical protein FD724_37180 (plasmid) [Nostoc sp. C057]|uniref:hypothetical protein n=1 Tax=Nostoc sp. C057 TaxID=2576903 RepID=UPI0015C31D37|nr:hypothetical protein [Nostoc sp. C057]QLE53521.1 hypothetical protein FD724_37180 [Nostoc sp. C057]
MPNFGLVEENLCTKALVEWFIHTDKAIALAAPTGKAANRMKDTLQALKQLLFTKFIANGKKQCSFSS